MSAELSGKLLETSGEQSVRSSAMTFLEGEQTFQWITGVLMHSGLSKEVTHSAILHLRNYGDTFRAEALFTWLDQTEW